MTNLTPQNMITASLDFKTTCQRLGKSLEEKGFVTPTAEFTISSNRGSICLIYKATAFATANYEFIYFNMDQIDAAIAIADAFITKLKSPTDVRMDNLRKAIAKNLDEAKDLGLPDDFINPLVAMMEKLSTNILTHDKPEAV